MQLLSKELDVHAKARSEAVEALQLSEQVYQQAQKEILQKDWDVKNTSAVKDSKCVFHAADSICIICHLREVFTHSRLFEINFRIKELVEKVNQMKAKHKKEEEVNNRKYSNRWHQNYNLSYAQCSVF